MKRLIYLFAVAAAFAAVQHSSYAQQNLRSGYFLDGYTYGYKLNPAFQGERGFLAIPVLGKVGMGVESNLGLSTFLYPASDGQLTTFLSPEVKDADFLAKIKPSNKFMLNADLPVFALGFRTGKMYHTLDVSLRADADANIPGDLLSFMKLGASDGKTSWDISNIGGRLDARAELAYGISRRFGRNLSVGARFKVLMGVARAEIAMDEMNLKMAEDEWAVRARGNGMISGPITVKTYGEAGDAASGQANVIDWSTIEIPESVEDITAYLKTPSLGFAVDLGASYTFLDLITVSASVLDLGALSWKHSTSLQTPQTSWNFQGFENISMSGKDNAIADQLETMTDELMNSFNLEKTGTTDEWTSPLAWTLHAGIEAKLPFYKRLSVGALATHRFDGAYSWTEGRFSINWALLRCFAISGNYAVSSFGNSFGAAANIHLPGLTLFAGVDSLLPLRNVTPKYYIPIDSMNTNVTFGLNFAFGKYKGQFPKKDKKARE